MAKPRTGTMREKKPGTWQLIVTMERKQQRLIDSLTKMERLGDSLTKMERLGDRIVARQEARKQERRYETVHGTEAEARTRLEAMQAESEGDTPSTDTMAGLMAEWTRSESHRWKPGTKVRYRDIVKIHVLPFIGERAVVSLKAKDILAFYATLRENGRSEATIAKINTLLTTVFVFAIDVLELPLPKNPCSRLRMARVRKPEIKIPSNAQVQDMLALAVEEQHPLAAAAHLAVYTGMRRGEIAGLTWEHVNLATGVLEVRQTLSYGDGVALGSPKTPSSDRDIDLDPTTVAVLQAHREAQDTHREAMGGKYKDQDFVFANPKGDTWHPHTLTRLVAGWSGRTGRRVRFQDLRHFHASTMLNAGVNVVTVSRRLGHSKVFMTLNVYGHLVDGSQRRAADVFAEAMNSARNSANSASESYAQI